MSTVWYNADETLSYFESVSGTEGQQRLVAAFAKLNFDKDGGERENRVRQLFHLAECETIDDVKEKAKQLEDDGVIGIMDEKWFGGGVDLCKAILDEDLPDVVALITALLNEKSVPWALLDAKSGPKFHLLLCTRDVHDNCPLMIAFTWQDDLICHYRLKRGLERVVAEPSKK